MKDFKLYASALVVGVLISILVALIIVGVSALFMDKDNESQYKLIKTKSIIEVEKIVKKLYFWEEREKCVFLFKDENGEEVPIDLAKDIVYFRPCKENTLCTETLDNQKYRIYYGSGMVISEAKLMSFVNMCTEIHSKGD